MYVEENNVYKREKKKSSGVKEETGVRPGTIGGKMGDEDIQTQKI